MAKQLEMSQASQASQIMVQTASGPQPLSIQTAALDPDTVKLYDIARVWAAGNKIDAASIITFATTLVRAIQQIVLKSGDGSRKKQIVLTVLRLTIQNDAKRLSESDRQMILGLVDTVVPVAIDTIIGVATGRIDISKEWNKYFGTCCPCLPIKPKSKPKNKHKGIKDIKV